MRHVKHPWRWYLAFFASCLFWTFALHPFLSPTAPAWLLVVGEPAFTLPTFWLWMYFPGIKRFLRRLPHAIRLGIFAWQQQAALERAEHERLSQEKYRRLYGIAGEQGLELVHVEPGQGYIPIGRVDLTKVKPPQRPSPIAPQRFDDDIKTMEQYLKRHPEMNQPGFDEKMAELAERIEDVAEMMGVPVKRAFQEAWKLHGMEEPDVPHWVDWDSALQALQSRLRQQKRTPCALDAHDWLWARIVGGPDMYICRKCGTQEEREPDASPD